MVVIATLGGINGNIPRGARVLYAMADAGMFLRAAGRCIRASARRRRP